MTITPESAAILGGVMALASGLVRIIERLIDALVKKKEGPIGPKALGFRDQLNVMKKVDELYDWHNHDMPGSPGVKCWWSTALREPIEDLRSSIERLTQKLESK